MSVKESLSVMVDVIVENDKLPLVKRKKIHLKGLSFPGCKVDIGEKVEEAITREVREVMRLDVELIHILGV